MTGQVFKLNAEPKGRWVEFYSAPSHSNPDTTYVVAKDKNGEWGCSCPRWIFHRDHCKHIRAVEIHRQRGLATIELSTLTHKQKKALWRITRIEVYDGKEEESKPDPGENAGRIGFLELD